MTREDSSLTRKGNQTITDAYNFLGAWQLFPEKGTYEHGTRPKSAVYRINFHNNQKTIQVTMNWVTLEDLAFSSDYVVIPDGEEHVYSDPGVADLLKAQFQDTTHFQITFYRNGALVLEVLHEINAQGHLKVMQRRIQPDGAVLSNEEIYHRQLSVLPYAASVSGALVKPNEEGVIRHKALSAMEEQTNMQLTQIRQQIELLAIQAKEIQKRKELSMIVYNAKLSFEPVIGQTYYLYEKEDGSHLVSMVSPREWGVKIPFKSFLASVKLLADHTWQEV
jgi:Protein of unknown function (DUF2452)